MGAYNDEFLFIHIPKCAGTSIREWLKRHLPNVTDFRDDGSGLPIGHIPLRDIERFTGRSPSSFSKIIAIVRNPYTHQISQWLFWRERRAQGGMHLHDRVAASHATLTDFLCDARCDFHVWYESQYGSSDDGGERLRRAAAMVNRYPHFGGYYPYWLTVDGEFPDNLTVMRMEQLADTWHQELRPYVTGDMEPLPIVNAGRQSIHTPQDAIFYLSPLAIEIINDKFEWAFETKLYNMFIPDNPHAFAGFGT